MQLNITGVRLPNGKVNWCLMSDTEYDNETIAAILERVLQVMKDEANA